MININYYYTTIIYFHSRNFVYLVGINGLPETTDVEDDTGGGGSSAVVGTVVVLICWPADAVLGISFARKETVRKRPMIS
jgi:hypothetical protein